MSGRIYMDKKIQRRLFGVDDYQGKRMCRSETEQEPIAKKPIESNLLYWIPALAARYWRSSSLASNSLVSGTRKKVTMAPRTDTPKKIQKTPWFPSEVLLARCEKRSDDKIAPHFPEAAQKP